MERQDPTDKLIKRNFTNIDKTKRQKKTHATPSCQRAPWRHESGFRRDNLESTGANNSRTLNDNCDKGENRPKTTVSDKKNANALPACVALSPCTHLSEEVSVQVNLPEPRPGEGKESGPLAERLEGNAENRREHGVRGERHASRPARRPSRAHTFVYSEGRC